MGTPLPPQEIKFAQLAAKLQYVSQDQVRSSLELYRRYQAAGGDVPSIPRILVQKGYLARDRAEILLRHLLKGEPLPAPGTPSPALAVPAPASWIGQRTEGRTRTPAGAGPPRRPHIRPEVGHGPH